MMSGRIRVIGLTGGIASGKSSVARYFQDKGVEVIDADQLAREVVSKGSSGLALVANAFGKDILTSDGLIDRKRLGAIVFADSEKRTLLESILHPEIKRHAEERIAAIADTGNKVVFYMAPLLIEAGATDRVDEIWVVTVHPEIQLERLMRRDGLSRSEAERIVASQMPLAEKERHGKVVINNSGTPEETWQQLDSLWTREFKNNG